MNRQYSNAEGDDSAYGRLILLAEGLSSIHLAQDLPRLAGRFEFLGERALGARLSALALSDESLRCRAIESAVRRPTSIETLWQELQIAKLSSNDLAAAAFDEVRSKGVPGWFEASQLFAPSPPDLEGLSCLVVPVSFNQEYLGAALHLAPLPELAEPLSTILASHTAVAVQRMRDYEQARRLHGIDPKLWVPDNDFLLTQLGREVGRVRRYGGNVGLSVLKIDNEATIRERHGDFLANHLVRCVGGQLLRTVRDSDIVGALSGGFGIIQVGASFEGAEIATDRLGESIRAMVKQRFPEINDVQVSTAVVACPENGSTTKELLAVLDVSADIATSEMAISDAEQEAAA